MVRRPPPKVVSEPVLADIARRFAGFPVPDDPIRPRDLSPEELRRFGLPPKPSATAPAILKEAWGRAFGAELRLLRFTPEESSRLIRQAPFPITARRLRVFSAPASPVDTSGNWAGAYVTANRDRRFTQIWGAWSVPKDLTRPPPPRDGVPGLPSMCSHWIGLDGQRRYLDASLPQVGTASEMDVDGTELARSWVQWWARDAPANLPTWLPLPTAPGDDVVAVLTAVDPQNVEAVLVNLQSPVPVGMAIAIGAPTVLVAGAEVTPAIAGVTAEWIVERPSIPGGGRIFNLPDYGASTFETCVAVECAAVDLQGLASGIPQLLHGARLIRMVEVEADPPTRVALLSLARRVGPSSVRVAYGGFGNR